jgi:hypothetical protein
MNFSQFFNEAGFAHVRRIMMGDVPEVDSVGIITGYNPSSVPHAKTYNKTMNKQLMSDLRAGGYGPLKIRGKFGGNPEDSFLIRNITREELIALGQKYGQDAVIWGQKRENPEGAYFDWEYIDHGETVQHRSVSVAQPDVRNRNDFYSQKSGRKFTIPFFDDPYKDYQQQGSRIVLPQEPAQEPAAAMSKEGFFIPYFDEANFDHQNVSPDGHYRLTYMSSELPMYRGDVKELVEKVWYCEEQLQVAEKTGRYYWQWRGMLSEALRDLECLL